MLTCSIGLTDHLHRHATTPIFAMLKLVTGHLLYLAKIQSCPQSPLHIGLGTVEVDMLKLQYVAGAPYLINEAQECDCVNNDTLVEKIQHVK